MYVCVCSGSNWSLSAPGEKEASGNSGWCPCVLVHNHANSVGHPLPSGKSCIFVSSDLVSYEQIG